MRFSIFVLVVALSVGCVAQAATPAPTPPAAAVGTSSVEQNVRLHVEDMVCEGCAQEIREHLQPLDGVRKVDVRVKEHLVIVDYDSSRVDVQRIIKAIDEAGYKATT